MQCGTDCLLKPGPEGHKVIRIYSRPGEIVFGVTAAYSDYVEYSIGQPDIVIGQLTPDKDLVPCTALLESLEGQGTTCWYDKVEKVFVARPTATKMQQMSLLSSTTIKKLAFRAVLKSVFNGGQPVLVEMSDISQVTINMSDIGFEAFLIGPEFIELGKDLDLEVLTQPQNSPIASVEWTCALAINPADNLPDSSLVSSLNAFLSQS